MGQILSHSEVEAVLSALNFPSPAPTPPSPVPTPAPTEDWTLYDFEHPEPLRRAQLDALRLQSAATSQELQSGLASLLRASVTVSFLGVEQSTFRDYLATAEHPGCLAVFESSASAGVWLLEIGRSLAFTIVDCMLGGQPSENHPAVTMPRPFTEVETRLIDKAVRTILSDLAGGLTSRNPLRMTRLVSDGSLISEATSNDAVALVSFEVACGPSRGLMQLCIPWKEVAIGSQCLSTEGADLREIMRSGATKVPVVATARIARLKLSTREIASLSPGDVLLTDTSPQDEIRLEVDGHEIFRGTPGQSHDRKVILLTAPLSRGRSAGAPIANAGPGGD